MPNTTDYPWSKRLLEKALPSFKIFFQKLIPQQKFPITEKGVTFRVIKINDQGSHLQIDCILSVGDVTLGASYELTMRRHKRTGDISFNWTPEMEMVHWMGNDRQGFRFYGNKKGRILDSTSFEPDPTNPDKILIDVGYDQPDEPTYRTEHDRE